MNLFKQILRHSVSQKALTLTLKANQEPMTLSTQGETVIPNVGRLPPDFIDSLYQALFGKKYERLQQGIPARAAMDVVGFGDIQLIGIPGAEPELRLFFPNAHDMYTAEWDAINPNATTIDNHPNGQPQAQQPPQAHPLSPDGASQITPTQGIAPPPPPAAPSVLPPVAAQPPSQAPSAPPTPVPNAVEQNQAGHGLTDITSHAPERPLNVSAPEVQSPPISDIDLTAPPAGEVPANVTGAQIPQSSVAPPASVSSATFDLAAIPDLGQIPDLSQPANIGLGEAADIPDANVSVGGSLPFPAPEDLTSHPEQPTPQAPAPSFSLQDMSTPPQDVGSLNVDLTAHVAEPDHKVQSNHLPPIPAIARSSTSMPASGTGSNAEYPVVPSTQNLNPSGVIDFGVPDDELPESTNNPIDEILRQMLQQDCSDLHLSVGVPPYFRVNGEMVRLGTAAIDPERMQNLLLPIMPLSNRQEFAESSDTDFAYELPGQARFRVNVFRNRLGVAAVLRHIPTEILTADQLGLPPAIRNFCQLHKGLVLVTGPTGSGKSTTLAAMIDLINKSRAAHILTVEDPIEFVYKPENCLINQRQVGRHTKSFSRALRAALREDPDIVLIGEMRDLETIETAIETAETGHLVFGTLHTTTAISTVDRIVDQFPPEQQEQIRVMLSESLKGVVSQTLLKKNGGGRVAAHEILVVNKGISALLREGKTHMIGNQMTSSRAEGNQLLNDCLIQLITQGVVTPYEAYMKAVDKSALKSQLESKGISLENPSAA